MQTPGIDEKKVRDQLKQERNLLVDADLNILRASLHLELPGQWRDYQSVVTYGWLRPAEETPRLIPLTISTKVEFKKKIYWCRGLFTNYRVFTSRAKIVATGNVQGLPR